MALDLSGSRRPEPGHRLTWNDVAPRCLRDNPQYAMYKEVLDSIARLLGEDAR
jgi:hypothetical protein